MPRLDNSHPDVLEYFDIEFNEQDPGRNPPIDICLDCSYAWDWDLISVAHPQYEEQNPPYTCRMCGIDLNELDNGCL